MTVGTLAISEPVPHRPHAVAQPLSRVARRALQSIVRAFERIVGESFVIEGRYFERLRRVAHIALTLRRGQPKLARMNIAVATGALAWRPSIRSAPAALSILGRWGVAAIAGSFGVRAGQGPDIVVDTRRVPPALGVTLGTAASSHFRGELIPVWIFMTVDAGAGVERETESRTLASVTTGAWNELVPSLQRKPRAAMLQHGE